MPPMHVSVIVPARDAQDTLPRTLESLARQELDGEYEVIVVDDGSRDRTREIAARAGEPVSVLTQPPRGPGAARNLGVSHAHGGALAFCDADVFPTAGWLRAGLRALTRAELVQGKVLPDPSSELGPFDRTIWIDSTAALWEAANLFVSRSLFDRAGGFPDGIDPGQGKVLGEDVMFGYRARELGARAAFAEDALAYHAVFPRDWRAYVGERRRLRYFPALARQAPALRDSFLYHELFLSRRTARFDAALLGLAVALKARSLWPLLGAWPYLAELRRHAGRAGDSRRHVAAVAAADLTADVTGFAALLSGSLRHGSPVL
jgi:glycosyltransferase involved in cell wall biosynthesis